MFDADKHSTNLVCAMLCGVLLINWHGLARVRELFDGLLLTIIRFNFVHSVHLRVLFFDNCKNYYLFFELSCGILLGSRSECMFELLGRLLLCRLNFNSIFGR